MPELPEVESTRIALENIVINNIITMTKVLNYSLKIPIPSNIDTILVNKKIISINRIAKYLLINLNNGYSLISHLGMSGSWRVREKTKKHDHFLLKLDSNLLLAYNDPRRFGIITTVCTKNVKEHSLLKNIGYDPFDLALSPSILYQLTQQAKSSIKTFLMDGTKINGIGNIYASEILFMAKIHPTKQANYILPTEAENMLIAIKKILKQAINNGGTSIQSYISPNEKRGTFQSKLKVYNRANKNCYICNMQIKQIKQNNRSTFYCENCQQ
ncbi:Formamidopyrimidine-DNA glycosylase [Candidatus Xenohaliotis californiensis]|uniref:Formamidopyrimidine-DNA glycosylase n=1 Tax=Candidatus Xenohaliotis californiensis TaxID=84677 RepID=A0ABP0EVD6_9RICK|nr:Formamidopyrimidine-DNA glycosylase [Candidatus Xenohaliotis californiensis]